MSKLANLVGLFSYFKQACVLEFIEQTPQFCFGDWVRGFALNFASQFFRVDQIRAGC